MVATLQSRKEALEAKIQEKNEELKKLCLQEADLTGVIPPEIPLEPGEPPPPIRRRVGTSFSFPQNLLNNIKDADEESLIALEVECKVQTNIAEAALTLANDTTVNKAARRKHRLMYRQSQRRLSELEARLNLLKQGKSDQTKLQQIKKKPRPNTTAVENIGFMWHKGQVKIDGQLYNGSTWHGKKTGYSTDEIDATQDYNHGDIFSSLHRSYKSSGTSHGSNSPRIDLDSDDTHSQTFVPAPMSNQFLLASSYPNVQDASVNKIISKTSNNVIAHKRSPKRGMVRRQWDTQSAGGTLLPNQTYPDHSHQPNLSRTQSLGSVEANSQRSSKGSWSAHDFPLESNASKEKEWYETALDSAPSPPLRTSSRLPSTARMLYQMQEIQAREWNGLTNLPSSNSHPALPTTPSVTHKNIVRSVSAYQAGDNIVNEDLASAVHQMNLHTIPKARIPSMYVNENGCLIQNDFNYGFNHSENVLPYEYPKANEQMLYQNESKTKPDLSHLDSGGDVRFPPGENLELVRRNSLSSQKGKGAKQVEDSENLIKRHEVLPDNGYRSNDTVYINIPEDNAECAASMKSWMNEVDHTKGDVKAEYQSKPKIPTQPYYHSTKPNFQHEKIENLQYQAARNRLNSIEDQQQPVVHHPPHAITQNEITFDTVVPFESPQNHTVVQAGKWQPYREVTKPFEMSDFYKYSTKFRQNNPGNKAHRASTPEVTRNSPNTLHQKAVYTPLRPMTCQPIESKSNQMMIASNQLESHYEDDIDRNQLVEVSLPEIV